LKEKEETRKKRRLLVVTEGDSAVSELLTGRSISEIRQIMSYLKVRENPTRGGGAAISKFVRIPSRSS
jgi:hypothetical protein